MPLPTIREIKMSGLHFEPGTTPVQRMTMGEFIRTKLHRLDENHTTLFLKKVQMEKDLANLNEQILMLEGAHQYLDQFLAEWDKYENDTKQLRIAEETARRKLDEEQKKRDEKPSEQPVTPRRTRKEKSKKEENPE